MTRAQLGVRSLIVVYAAVVTLFTIGMVGLASSGGDVVGLQQTSGHFPNALTWGSPDPWARDGTFRGYEWATASELARTDQGKGFGHKIRFVAADRPSTGNLVVSVHPIDHFTWAATALASNGRCYAVLVAHNRTHPKYGTTHEARFPRGTPCKAELATRASVRPQSARQ
jgi:hypothetical protein